MEKQDGWIIGAVLANMAIVLYEHSGSGSGWRIYIALVAILLLAAISRTFAILILIPLTGYNLLVNTTRLIRR